MDNQQAIGLLLGGLYSGEGHFSLWKAQRDKKWELRSEIGFSNNDPAILVYVMGILDSKNIRYHIRENSSKCFQIIVHHYLDMLSLVDLVNPGLIGRKKAEAEILQRYIRNRQKYQKGGNKARQYNDSDFAIVAEKEKLRESSETTSLAELKSLGRYSPALQETVGTN